MEEIHAIAVYKHRWEEISNVTGELWLARESEAPTRVYYPLAEDPLLFRSFARLSVEPGEIQAFAEQYGDVGPRRKLPAIGIRKDVDAGEEIHGTCLDVWERCIAVVRQLSDSWSSNEGFGPQDQELLNSELKPFAYGASCSPSVQRTEGNWQVWLAPHDIYGVCLVQIVGLMTERTRVFQCGWCGDWGVRGPTEKRKRKYCNDAHRLKAYRKRKREEA